MSSSEEVIHLAKVDGPWHPIARAADGLPWRNGEERRYKLRARRDAFQTEGRYALRFRVVELGPASESIQMSEAVRVSHGSTQTIASSRVMHHFKVHPASLALSFLAFVVGSLVTLVSLLATVVFT